EGAVDLELVEGKFPQTAERGLARAKIIECDTRTGILQLVDDCRRRVRLRHQTGFGDLNFQAPRIEPGPVANLEYVTRRRQVDELLGRQVEGQEQMPGPDARHLRRLAKQQTRQVRHDAAL